MVRAVLVAILLFTSITYAQRRVDPRNSYYRVIGAVPIVGTGTPADPKRPKYAPWPPTQSQSGTLAFYWEPSDDGKSAIVEFAAPNRAAYQSLLADQTVTVFEKGKATAAQIQTALKPFRKDFDPNKFGLMMPYGSPGASVSSGYQYYLSDNFTSINAGRWTVTGSVAASSAGLTAPTASGGSATSSLPVPDGSSEGEVRMTVALTGSGGNYTEFLQASPDARSGGTGSGTYLAFEMQNPTFSGTQCAANFAVLQSIAGSASLLAMFPHACRNGMAMRMAVHNGMLLVWPDEDAPMEFLVNAPASGAGQPGIGAYATPPGNAISQVQLGAVERAAPVALNQGRIGVAAFPNHVDMQWPAVTAVAAGPGLAGYWIYRDGSYFMRTSAPNFHDETVTPKSSHTYTIYAVDQHLNFSPGANVTVSVPALPPPVVVNLPLPPTNTSKPPKPNVEAPQIAPPTPKASPAGGFDPRRVGVQATGAYWGAAGEQIDLASGNLNFSVPILTAQARSGWSATFRLSYNSQMWRQDSAGEWLLAQDVGFGLGWKLLAGAVTPIWSSGSLAYYLYTDATGAEYRLDQNNGNVWTSIQGTYVSFDANTNILHFNDGTFWIMGCQSAGGEQDAGTFYPTIMEDTNGNQISIYYLPGNGSSSGNTSARISQITDPRAPYPWEPCFTFSYNSDPIPHLTQESGFQSSYTLSYVEGQPLNSPFSGASFGTTTLLGTLTTAEVSNQHPSSSFQYSTGSGEMTQMTTIFGGTLQWQYRTFTYGTGISQREVYYRFMPQYAGVYWYFAHNDAYDETQPFHGYTQWGDSATNASKVYWFSTAPSGAFVVPGAYVERTPQNNGDYLAHIWGWTQGASGNTYTNLIYTFLSPTSPPPGYCCSGFLQSATTQTLDTYGNLTQQQVYDYGASTPTRTYTMTYITDPNYVSRYIRNRLSTANVSSSSGNLQLASNVYDNGNCGANNVDPGSVANPPSPGSPIFLHDDTNYGTNFDYRGNVTHSVTLSGSNCSAYTTTGTPYVSQNGSGMVVTTSTSPATSYSLPGVIMPNSNNNLASTLSYDTSWNLTSVTAPNGATATTTYDGTLGFPVTSTSSDGAVTNFTYSFSPGANVQTATISTTVNNTTTTQWKKTTMDGFGRVTSVQTGHDSTTVSETDTQYAPCACSPLGKISAVSLPYAPGQSPQWTTYAYDGSGRTISITKPDGSVASDSYAGNTTTETDPAGKWKTFTKDTFGNLTMVTEPDPNNAPGTVTTYYTYNVANQLTQVSMPRNGQNQLRTFTWSGTDLASATNPENGTVTYLYDGAHHVTLRTDAKGQQTQYSYDTYGRLTQTRHYDWQNYGYGPFLQQTDEADYHYDTPMSSFGNNTWGRLSGVAWGSPGFSVPTLWYEYNYNQPGRVTGQRMAIPFSVNGSLANQLNLDATYTWDNQGRMTWESTPAGATYQYSYDAMSNLAAMQQLQSCYQYNSDGTCANGAYIPVASAQYNWTGQLTTLSYNDGAWPYTNVTETRTYNNLLQLTRLQNNGLDMQYVYQAGQNNGRIVKSIDSILAETVNYTYDSLNRLVSAEEASGKWGNAFSYDEWGTINGQTWTPGQAATPGTAAPPGPRDANGNYLGPYAQGEAFLYDVENRLVWQPWSSGNYGYDPWGKRVMQCCSATDGSTTYTFFDINGKRQLDIHVINNGDGTYQSSTVGTYTYFGRKLIVMNGATVATDRLGSIRSNSNGEQFSYYPYGRERTSTPDGRPKFGTYLRDGILLNAIVQDYADQRYFEANSGTFWSPDPGGITTADPKNPTSWNRYLYANADPINFNDPTGTIVSGGCPAEYSYDECVALGLIVGTPGDTEGGGGGGDPCGGSYFAPNPDPSCYAPVPPSANEGPAAPDLRCNFDGSNNPTAAYFGGGEFGIGYYMPISFTFSATGGSAAYTWDNDQTYRLNGSVAMTNGQTYSISRVLPEKIDNIADNPNGPVATLYDTPGLVQTSRLGTVASAALVYNFNLQATVSSGGMTVQCPDVSWQAVLVWQTVDAQPVVTGKSYLLGVN